MAVTSRISKLQAMLDHYLRVTIQDDRTFVGKMIAFDRHLNIVLSDCEEFRRIKSSGKNSSGPESEEKRVLGLIVLRGEAILTLKVEAAPPTGDKRGIAMSGMSGGPGIARGAGRGIPIAPTGIPPMGVMGLTAPVRGAGGPSASMMAPQMGRGMPPPMMPVGRVQNAAMGVMPMPPMMPPPPRPGAVPPMMGPPTSVPGIPPPTFGRGMPMPDPAQMGFHPTQMGQMPAGFVPGAPGGAGIPMPSGQVDMMNPAHPIGYPPQMPPPQHQNFRPPQPQSPTPHPPHTRPPQ